MGMSKSRMNEFIKELERVGLIEIRRRGQGKINIYRIKFVVKLASKTARFLKAELKRGGVTYAELATRLRAHGLEETESSIANKLSRGTIAATFLLATLAALELEGVRLEDL
jgi:hypothetical protein